LAGCAPTSSSGSDPAAASAKETGQSERDYDLFGRLYVSGGFSFDDPLCSMRDNHWLHITYNKTTKRSVSAILITRSVLMIFGIVGAQPVTAQRQF
jgi:hypothetical protein